VIASITGTVVALTPASVVLEVGGIGIAVSVTPQVAVAARAGDRLALHTSLIVREDSLTLYGFLDGDQRDIFEAVQTVTGIGPRTALAVLATLSPDGLRRAIASEDVASLTRVPGIGTKGAQRMIIELRDRIGQAPRDEGDGDWQVLLREALGSLGWSDRDAESAVAAVVPSAGPEPDLSTLLRAALQHLDRR
jgi:holliday junction DNA helicase RuvA